MGPSLDALGARTSGAEELLCAPPVSLCSLRQANTVAQRMSRTKTRRSDDFLERAIGAVSPIQAARGRPES